MFHLSTLLTQITFTRCETGYKRNVDTGDCDDIDECDTGAAKCHIGNQACLNTLGSYKCLDILETGKSASTNDNNKCEEGYQYLARIEQCVGESIRFLIFPLSFRFFLLNLTLI